MLPGHGGAQAAPARARRESVLGACPRARTRPRVAGSERDQARRRISAGAEIDSEHLMFDSVMPGSHAAPAGVLSLAAWRKTRRRRIRRLGRSGSGAGLYLDRLG